MIHLKLNVDASGARREMEIAVSSLKDLDRALRRFANWLQLKAQRRFDQQGPGWEPLKKKQAALRAARSMGAFERKLQGELRRAERKAKTAKAVERRLLTLAEFRRLERGGAIDKSLLSAKQSQKLSERMGRAAAGGHKVLGAISRSIKAEVSKHSLTVFSEIPWAGVHNDGGAIGHGATEPKRTFLELDEEDLDAFEKMILGEVESALAG